MQGSWTCRETEAQRRPSSLKSQGEFVMWEQGWGPVCQLFAGHPVLAGHPEPQGDRQTNRTISWAKKRGLAREEGGRKEGVGGPSGLPLDRGNREAGCFGPVAGSDLWPKQMCLRVVGGRSPPCPDGIKGKQEP